jgi:NAD-dependent DNA ligase
MEPSDSPLLEPIEYEERLERARHIEDPLRQHNVAIELLRGAQRDRSTASDPQYDRIIRKLQALERESGARLARTRE